MGVALWEIGGTRISLRRRDGTTVFDTSQRLAFVRHQAVYSFRGTRNLKWAYGQEEVHPFVARKWKAASIGTGRWEFSSSRGVKDIVLDRYAGDPRDAFVTGALTIFSVATTNIGGNTYDTSYSALPPARATIPFNSSIIVAEFQTVARDAVVWRRCGFDVLIDRGNLILRQWAGQGRRDSEVKTLNDRDGTVRLDCTIDLAVSEINTTGRTIE